MYVRECKAFVKHFGYRNGSRQVQSINCLPYMDFVNNQKIKTNRSKVLKKKTELVHFGEPWT